MRNSHGLLRKYGAEFLIFSGSLFLFYVLSMLRFLDDSRLVSWEDVFSVVQPLRTGVILCFSLVAAFMFSRLGLIERRPRTAL
ncbi:MAG: hypothetical protein HZA15_00650, partial [Nitrospirae bacterium]|nr:hypothetical protein [Nitrospirota bacterium]